MKRVNTTILGLAVFVASAIAQESPLEKVLLPISDRNPMAGAFGAQWEMFSLMFNSSDEEVVTPSIGCGIPPCQLRLGPREFTFIDAWHHEGLPGGVIYIPRRLAPQIHFHLRIFDRTRYSRDAGVEIPAVREKDLHSGTINLVPIPISSNVRQTLRVYVLEPLGRPVDLLIHIRPFQIPSNPPIARDAIVTVPLRVHVDGLLLGYSQLLGITDLYPQLASLSAMHLEIVPQTPGTRFWAFITVTNNETQLFTTVTPQ